jgi:2-C-methyl-D-erythritol 4-phosphate cytidylyltransferase
MKGVKGILLMGGSGTRFGGVEPKQFHLLQGVPLYQWVLKTFHSSQLFEEILLVTHKEWFAQVSKEVASYPNTRVVDAGPTRQASSLAGLLAAGPETQIVVIHDAVRPFVSVRIIKENVETAMKTGAADTCIPSADTLVHAPDRDRIADIPPRHEFLRGQTPQSFSYPLILRAHQQATLCDASDDCQLVHALGHTIAIVAGEERNLKVTTELDLLLAEQLAEKKPSLL